MTYFVTGATRFIGRHLVERLLQQLDDQPGLDRQAFHLTNPKSQRSGEIMNTIAAAAHAPQMTVRIDTRLLKGCRRERSRCLLMQLPAAGGVRRTLLADFGIPEEVLRYIGLTAQRPRPGPVQRSQLRGRDQR